MANDLKWFGSDGTPQIEQNTDTALQDVLDRALDRAVINREYDIADFLLDHGADINTRWRTHEPARTPRGG